MPGADFSRPSVETIAKRAGNHCSNPDCGALTCGPSETEARAITIGEAAHIYGAREGAARYRDSMSDVERADITNGIWLCRNCHKVVDADPLKFPAEILFEWRRLHERDIAQRLGKPSDAIRQKILDRELREFADSSYMAQQIVIDKPDFWEYKLTVELLRSRLKSVMDSWRALKQGLYVRSGEQVAAENAMAWFLARFNEAGKFGQAFSGLVNNELPKSWGSPGQPGDPKEIMRVTDLIVDGAEQILRWEEAIAFVSVPNAFEELREVVAGSLGRMLDQISRIPAEMDAIFAEEKPSGTHYIGLVFDLPEGWTERVREAMAHVVASYE